MKLRISKLGCIVLGGVAWVGAAWVGAAPPATQVLPDMALVQGGEFTPLYDPTGQPKTIRVRGFYLDRFPVTKGEFMQFLKAHPEWRRERAPSIFRDENYLADLTAEATQSRQPVVNVSWFAARAYCQAQGKRLPTQNEWEYAAQAGQHAPTATTAERTAVLRWYLTPATTTLPAVGSGSPNYWGIYDLQSLVWEWVEDFNTAITTGDNRADADTEKNLFCGASAGLATERTDFAAYMRFAFRSSLHPAYGGANLGFRCAADAPYNTP